MSLTSLSKSQFIRGLQCHKSLWLYKNNPELRDEIPPEQQAVFQSGTNVGILAQGLFPGGVEIPYDGLSLSEQLDLTRQELANGTQTIYEATFCHNEILVKADILHHGPTGWELYEVKSSTEAKDVYLNDIAVQQYVLNGAGIQLAKAALVHMNREYVRQGAIDVHGLFTITDVTDKARELQAMVVCELPRMRDTLQGGIPVIDIGPHCANPYPCDFRGHCWQHIPENSVFSLSGNGIDKFKSYRLGKVKIEDLSLDDLPRSQRIQAEGYLHHKNAINQQAIRSFLDSLWYPLCFLDFETTYMTPVPLFDGTRPYQQVPFQYSLHILDQPGGTLQHYEFLANAGEHPMVAFLDNLIAVMPENACVLTYNKVFEIGRLNELALFFPAQKTQIDAIINNIRDLMELFRSKHVYYWQMDGAYSIKAVLPALVPEMSYKELEIQNGAVAAEAYLRTLQLQDQAEINRLRTALLKYCQLDTFAMVKILEKLQTLISSQPRLQRVSENDTCLYQDGTINTFRE